MKRMEKRFAICDCFHPNVRITTVQIYMAVWLCCCCCCSFCIANNVFKDLIRDTLSATKKHNSDHHHDCGTHRQGGITDAEWELDGQAEEQIFGKRLKYVFC